MRRLLRLDIVLFALGLGLGAALNCPAGAIAWVGALSAAFHRVRYQKPWGSAALGFFVAVLLASHPAPPSPLRVALADGPTEFMVEGTLVDGPRTLPRGAGYELRLERIDRTPVDERVRFFVTEPGEAVAGDRVRSFVRCSSFAPAEFPGDRGAAHRWHARGIAASCSTSEPLEVAHTARGTIDRIRGWLARRRIGLEGRLHDLLGRRAGVPTAMLTGTRSLVTDSEQRAHQRAGTAHLLAISGVHFGALAAIVWMLAGVVLRRSRRVTQSIGARRASAGVVLVTMLGYLLLVGAPISAMRAFVAMAAVALALMLGRRPSGLAAVSAAAAAMLLQSPQIIWDLGFQLSFAATGAIVLFWLRLPAAVEADRYAFSPDPRPVALARDVWRFVLMSWAATAVTAPILLGTLGEVSLIAFVTNVIAVPLVSLVIFPALLGGACALEFAPSLGEPFVWWATEAMLRLTIALESCAALPGAVLNPGVPPSWWVAVSVAAVFVAIADRCRVRSVVAAALAVGLASISAFEPRAAGWTLHFIPVGQGDATLIEAPDGQRVLVDAGGAAFGRDPGRWIVVPYLRRLGIQHLDALIITHPDTDHAGGVPAVLEHIAVDRLVVDPGRLPIAGLTMRRWRTEGSRNDRSIVTTIRAGPAVVLLTGDAESAAERNWLAHPHRVTVLKVAHHGSQTSSTAEFLDAAMPALAIVSAGRHSRFGHPHRGVVERLDARAARVVSTATHGLITVSLDEAGAITTRVRRP